VAGRRSSPWRGRTAGRRSAAQGRRSRATRVGRVTPSRSGPEAREHERVLGATVLDAAARCHAILADPPSLEPQRSDDRGQHGRLPARGRAPRLPRRRRGNPPGRAGAAGAGVPLRDGPRRRRRARRSTSRDRSSASGVAHELARRLPTQRRSRRRPVADGAHVVRAEAEPLRDLAGGRFRVESARRCARAQPDARAVAQLGSSSRSGSGTAWRSARPRSARARARHVPRLWFGPAAGGPNERGEPLRLAHAAGAQAFRVRGAPPGRGRPRPGVRRWRRP
jgi:hypothetical protein